MVPRVSAVSFLNTKPLVWGLLHGPQRGLVDLRFELPSACADSVASGAVDVGLVPSIEIARQGLDYIEDLGIASTGPVRSIYLISRVPASDIRTVAMDRSSRTSVALVKIILAQRHGVRPSSTNRRPNLKEMLASADAALIIGDPALQIDPVALPHYIYDLGSEWKELTGLPMVYAVWAGRLTRYIRETLRESHDYGRDHLEEIVACEAARLGLTAELTRAYLTRHIRFELDAKYKRGLDLFLKLANDC